MGRKIEVSFSPQQYPAYRDDSTTVVVIDIFRATSTMCVGLDNGIQSIIPVACIEDATKYKAKGYKVGAERNGEPVEGFDFGNSPFSFMDPDLKGCDVVMTTTNGTQAIDVAKECDELLIGSFLNISALCDYLVSSKNDVVLLCAGWKNRFSMEDTLFAGAVVERLTQAIEKTDLSDSALAAAHLFRIADGHLDGILENSSHRRRLKRKNMDKDVKLCLEMDQTTIIPIYKDGRLVPLNKN